MGDPVRPEEVRPGLLFFATTARQVRSNFGSGAASYWSVSFELSPGRPALKALMFEHLPEEPAFLNASLFGVPIVVAYNPEDLRVEDAA